MTESRCLSRKSPRGQQQHAKMDVARVGTLYIIYSRPYDISLLTASNLINIFEYIL